MKKKQRPCCVFCKRDTGVTFAIFTPRFPPFGTACTECEATLPPGTTVPADASAEWPGGRRRAVGERAAKQAKNEDPGR